MATSTEGSGVLFVIPGAAGRSSVVEARWLAAARLAAALGDRLGGAHLLTAAGLMTPEQVIDRALRPVAELGVGRRMVRGLPATPRVLIGDLRAWRDARRMRAIAEASRLGPYRLVVQLHRRFQDCGLALARRFGSPFVLRVEALEVREEEAWGVRRPMWGRTVERLGELDVMRRADLVASVSHVLDGQLDSVGVPADRRVVLPNGVDLDACRPGPPDRELRRAHGLEDRFVVGWVGGFRPFHGLEMIPEIARGLRQRTHRGVLCLVGTGPLLPDVRRAVRGMEDVVRLLPPVAPKEVPRWIRSFDVCLQLAGHGEFHYSPMKLYEYLGCGRPVVASRVGEVNDIVVHGREGFLAPAGDPASVVEAVSQLEGEPGLRRDMGDRARRTAERCGSWDSRASQLLDALETSDAGSWEASKGRHG